MEIAVFVLSYLFAGALFMYWALAMEKVESNGEAIKAALVCIISVLVWPLGFALIIFSGKDRRASRKGKPYS